MQDKQIFELHANICKALGHAIRIEIIDLLQLKELTFGEILESTGGLKSNLSQHLTVMVSKGILTQRKEGQNAYYRLSSRKVAQACRLMREVLVENLEKQSQLLKKA
jgi:DNA-binding transcriptional ArsR family regulator